MTSLIIERKGMTDRIPSSRLWKGQDLMLRLLLFGRQVYLKYSMDEMSVYAAQASFFIIMAAFPFFMVLLALIQMAPMIHEADLLRFLLPAIPGRFQGLLLKWFPALSYLSGMISLGRGLVMFIILTIFFTAIYTALPHRRLSICGQIPGAMFSAAGWALTSLAFSVYFRYFGTYAVTYGSLTAVILFMLWLYVSICILFVGAEINWFLLFYKEKIMSINENGLP